MIHLRPRVALAFLAVTLQAVACGGESLDPPSVQRTDSAGVQLTLSLPQINHYAGIQPTPIVVLGGPDATGPTQFRNIRGVLSDADGNLWVVDGGSKEVRLFRADGSHWKTVGGQGEGPGEYLRPRLLGDIDGDRVAIWDDRLSRMTLYEANGRLARTVSAGTDGDIPPQAFLAFNDGTILAQIPETFSAPSLEAGDILGASLKLLRITLPAGQREELASAPTVQWLWTGNQQVPLPFSIPPVFAIDGQRLFLAHGSAPRIRVYEGSIVTDEFGSTQTPTPVSNTHRAEYRAFFTEQLSDPILRAAYLSAIDVAEAPTLLPAYDRLIVDDAGRTWAQRYQIDQLGSRVWEVFDADRSALGKVNTPAGFLVHGITFDRIYGVAFDDLGVETVAVYQLELLR